MRKKGVIVAFVTSIVLVLTVSISQKQEINAFSNQVIQHGAVGEDVIELQARLKHIGFYTGEITGVFDWRTYWALRRFQYEFGMEIDGMAGTKTKEKLVKATEYDANKVKEEMYKPKGQQTNKSPTQQE